MNPQVKTILLTVLTLSIFTIAVIELTGISSTALWNKYEINIGKTHNHEEEAINERLKSDNKREDAITQMPKTKISFESDHFNFGKIKEGEKVKHNYIFTNTGEQPLMIANVIPSCGCTVPTYSKAPIAPGEKGEIAVEFNSTNRRGQQNKNIIIVSNADREKVSISFSAEVQ